MSRPTLEKRYREKRKKRLNKRSRTPLCRGKIFRHKCRCGYRFTQTYAELRIFTVP